MKQLLTPRWLLAELTGFLFAVYSAYNVFIIFRDRSSMPSEGVLISAVVALAFAILAVFMWTAGIKGKKYVIFMMIRRATFLVALLVLIVLKVRLISRSINYFDATLFYTYLYDGAYFLTLAGFLILFIYYAFILKALPFHTKAAVVLPVSAIILFSLSLIMEIILFFAYGMLFEANVLRTVVIRPVFYLGFIGLSLHFLYPLSTTNVKLSDKTQPTNQ
nr:hypothetical protein [uncultured Ruminococcus sp.]